MKPDKTSTTPLYIQIREDIRTAISTGTIQRGEKLPPVTTLAVQKDVTPATIRRALQDLIDEGLITSHVGRGTFVTKPDTTRQLPNSTVQTGNRLRLSMNRSLNEMMNLAQKPGVIAFTRGIGASETIEKGILTRMAQKALSSGEELFWDYGDPRGSLLLRKAIASLYREQNIVISPDQILVTSGTQQAIALIAQQAAENNTPVICETPCYSGVINAFSAFGLHIETLNRSIDGPDISSLSKFINPVGAIFYICPVLHNPMGTDISEQKQNEIATWAAKNNSIILADEVFRDLHFDDKQPSSFLKQTGLEHTIALGSLSKSFISGLRVGWLISSEEKISTLTQIKKAMDLGCPPLMQGIAQAFLEDENGYILHRSRVRDHYRTLCDITLKALSIYMPKGVTWTIPQGGFQLWISLPEKYSSIDLFLRSIENGVAFLPGPLQDIDNQFINSFRLCYGSLKPDEIVEGIKRLGEATQKYLSESPMNSNISVLGDF